jgi:hypothetical protein
METIDPKEKVRMSTYFPNYAGRSDIDFEVSEELKAAGIKVGYLTEAERQSAGEVKTIVVGDLHCWTFKRLWYYWVARGPGIPVEQAEVLHEKFGQEVRVDGHCGCPSPREWFKGYPCTCYHVDTEEGLKALADAIKGIAEAAVTTS